MSWLTEHVCFQFWFVHTIVQLSVTWSTVPSIPATQGSSSLKMLSWGEFHARDRNFIYLKIDGKAFRLKPSLPRLYCWDPEKRSGKIQMHTAPSSSPGRTFTWTWGWPARLGAVLSAPPALVTLPRALRPSTLLLALLVPTPTPTAEKLVWPLLLSHARPAQSSHRSPPAPTCSCMFPSDQGTHHTGLGPHLLSWLPCPCVCPAHCRVPQSLAHDPQCVVRRYHGCQQWRPNCSTSGLFPLPAEVQDREWAGHFLRCSPGGS